VLRKATRNRGSFPDDDAAQKLLYLGLKNLAKKWTMPVRDWAEAVNQFSILYEDRF
jgi:putative transposase